MVIAIHLGPTLTGHKMRGVGVYTKLLCEALAAYEPTHTYIPFSDIRQIRGEYDIVHYPFFDPFFLSLPLVKQKPTVVTVHDLIPIVFPDKFPRGIRGEIKWQIQKMSLLGAKRIITDSEHSKKDITRILKTDRNRVDVVMLAPDPQIQRVTEKAELERVGKLYQLPGQYILYVGDVNWNKNIEGLLRAFSLVSSKNNTIHLVCVGKAFLDEGLAETQNIKQCISELQISDKTHLSGYVPDTDLSSLYSKAALYVQPSWYEGFGLPILEAFACGCPVVGADNSSLKEIMGPSYKADAGDPSSIAGSIEDILSLSYDKRSALVQKGYVWVRKFSWQKVAKETIQTYEKMVSRK